MIALLRFLGVSAGLLIVAAPLAAEELTTVASAASAPHGSMKSSEDARPATAPARRLPVELNHDASAESHRSQARF